MTPPEEWPRYFIQEEAPDEDDPQNIQIAEAEGEREVESTPIE
jgi:hypothetical protein